MFKVTKSIWIFGLFKKCTFMEPPRKKRRLGVVESKCIVLMRRIEAAASESGTPGGATVEPHWSHTATQNTPATVSVRDSDHSHTSSVRLMENPRMTHMTWRQKQGIVTPVIVSTRGGELVIADLSLMFKGEWCHRWLSAVSWDPVSDQLATSSKVSTGFDQRRANEQVSACDQILQFSRVS